MKQQKTYIVRIIAVILSLFFTAGFFTGADADAAAAPGKNSPQPTSSKNIKPYSAPSLPAKKGSDSASETQDKTGVAAEGMYSPGSSSKPYSPFATNLSGSPSKTPSPVQNSVPSSFGSGWTGEVLTFAANNLLNSSDPASPQSPSVSPSAVISFLEGKGITIATSAQTQITNEVNGLISKYDNHPTLITGSPLARIFAIQIMCMKNTSTGQLVYPESFPQDMLDKDYSSRYQSSWNSATKGKTYTLDATYIYNSISYTASSVIWEDPAITPMASKDNSGVYSLDQIETNHLNSMKAQSGKINSLNLIGITQRAYAIKTNPPSMSISKGYEESTGNNGDSKDPYINITQADVVQPGSSATADFTVETGPAPTSALSATLNLSAAPNARIEKSGFKVSGGRGISASDFLLSLSDENRTATIKYTGSGPLPEDRKIAFSLDVEVTSPQSYMSEVCLVANDEVVTDNSTLTLKAGSYTWCFPTASLSQAQPSPSVLSSLPSSSQITMEIPGWLFQYSIPVTDIFWSDFGSGRATSLSEYRRFQPALPSLDAYSVNASDLEVKDLTTGQNVTSLFSASYTPPFSYDTGLPYTNGNSYGGYSLTPASLKVSWNGTWPSSSSGSPTSPIGYDLFEVSFPLTLKSSNGGSINSQISALPLTSAVQEKISAPATSQPDPDDLENAGNVENGQIVSSGLTATLGVAMPFKAEAAFPNAQQISSMSSSSLYLVFFLRDVTASASLDSVEINGISYSALPSHPASSNNGITLIPLDAADINYLKDHASSASNLEVSFNWTISSAPSYATVETGYLPLSSLNSSKTPSFTSLSAAKSLSIYTNGLSSNSPSPDQSSALTGIWFQNEYLQGGDAKGAKFSVQNPQGLYLTPSSSGNPPYSYSSTPYAFSSANGNGLFRIWGLQDGTYTVSETKLPEGADGSMPSFKVSLNYASGKPSAISDPNPPSLINESGFIVFNKQEGTSGLPMTGGRLKIALLCVALPALLALAGYASYRIYKLRS